MRCASGAATFGGCRMMANRHERYRTSQCVTSAGHIYRHERHTPLRGVTIVTMARVAADLAEVPPTMLGGNSVTPGPRLGTPPPCPRRSTGGDTYPLLPRALHTLLSVGRTVKPWVVAGAAVHRSTLLRQLCAHVNRTSPSRMGVKEVKANERI